MVVPKDISTRPLNSYGVSVRPMITGTFVFILPSPGLTIRKLEVHLSVPEHTCTMVVFQPMLIAFALLFPT